MLTWRLWRALRYPDEASPLFRRVRSQPSRFPATRWLRWVQSLYGAVAIFVAALMMVVAPAVLLLAANVLGALVAFNVTNTINRERQQGTYDLLALTPLGRDAANWQIAAACATRLDVVERIASLRSLALTTLILLFVYSLSGALLTPIPIVALLIGLNLDAIQSQIVGCLSGMLAQELGNRSTTFASLAIFAAAQIIVVYLPVTAVALLLYDTLRRAALDRWLVEGVTALVALVVLVVVREIAIRLLWRALERRLL